MPVRNQGTFDFMSVEVELQHYSFIPKLAEIALFKPKVASRLPALTFYYNPLHDLESLWWIAVWIILTHLDDSRTRTIERGSRIPVAICCAPFPPDYEWKWQTRCTKESRRVSQHTPLPSWSILHNRLEIGIDQINSSGTLLPCRGWHQNQQASFCNIHELFLKEFSLALFSCVPSPIYILWSVRGKIAQRQEAFPLLLIVPKD